MVRAVDAWDGLAALGTASLGSSRVAAPSLLLPESLEAPPGVPTVRYVSERPSRSGRRHYRFGPREAPLDVEFPIPTPELSRAPSTYRPDEGPIALVRGPVADGELELWRGRRPELVILSNARTLFAEGRPFVEAVGAIRRVLGPAPLLWAPRIARSNRVPFLLYVGVDLLDPIEAALGEAAGTRTDPELGLDALLADPSAPTAAGPGPGAVASLGLELRRAEQAARRGRLRELVESRLPSEPALGEQLRFADRDLFPLLESRTPVTAIGSRFYVLRESFRRPEVRRFRERFRNRYTPPPSKEVLLLVPCSKTKPYRNSRSHRRFAEALDGLRGRERVHVVSVTSPLGVVPRELEDLPPARHYDIPVTGDWDEGEREAVISGLDHLRSRGHYRRTVVHLDPEEYAFLRPTLPEGPGTVWTMKDDRSTSPDALSSLSQALAEAVAEASASPGALRVVREELAALARTQFGPEPAGRLFREPVRLHGRPWFQRISDGAGVDLATWREERGLFQLTVAGGERIGADAGLSVRVAPEVRLTGDLFDPGILRADPEVRAGDAVLLVQREEIVAVGEAAVSGPVMGGLGRGLSVRVRHRRGSSPPTDRDLPAEPDSEPGRSSSG